jgi:hypothetical protein
MTKLRYERRHERLASRRVFMSRVMGSVLTSLSMIAVALLVGTVGYHALNRIEPPMTWLAAFHQAALLLGGMGPVEDLEGDAVVIFDSLYALVCGVLLIAAIGVIFAPIFHRLMHRFHLPDRDG